MFSFFHEILHDNFHHLSFHCWPNFYSKSLPDTPPLIYYQMCQQGGCIWSDKLWWHWRSEREIGFFKTPNSTSNSKLHFKIPKLQTPSRNSKTPKFHLKFQNSTQNSQIPNFKFHFKLPKPQTLFKIPNFQNSIFPLCCRYSRSQGLEREN